MLSLAEATQQWHIVYIAKYHIKKVTPKKNEKACENKPITEATMIFFSDLNNHVLQQYLKKKAGLVLSDLLS